MAGLLGLHGLYALAVLPGLTLGGGLLCGCGLASALEHAVELLVAHDGDKHLALLEGGDLGEVGQGLAERADVGAAQVLGPDAVGLQDLRGAGHRGLLAHAQLSAEQPVQIQGVACGYLCHGEPL